MISRYHFSDIWFWVLWQLAQSCLTLCDPMDCSMPRFPVHHQLPDLTQTHVHRVSDTIQPSHPLSSPLLLPSIFPSIKWEIFKWVSSFHQVAKILELQVQHQSFQWIFVSFRIDWFDLAVQGTLKSLPQYHSSKGSILWHSTFFIVQLSHPFMTIGKNIALTRWTFVGKVMSLLFNMLSRFVIAFLPRSKSLLISWLQSPSAVILETKKIKSVTVPSVSPSICLEVMGPDAMIFIFWMLSFKPAFSLSSFTFIKRLFSSSLLSVIRVVSFAYLRLLMFLLEILIPASVSSSLAFCMMYSAYRLNKQGDNIRLWYTTFPIWNQFIVPCPVASWFAYMFLSRQVRWSGIPTSLRIFHSLLWSTQSKALA